MNSFFSGEATDPLFKLFGLSHIIPLIIIIIGVFLVSKYRTQLANFKNEKYIRYGMAAVLLISDLTIYVWRVSTETFDIKYALPLHLCTISAYALIVILITKSHKLFDYVFYAGLAGAIMALMNPEFGGFNHTHYRYYEFMIIHAFIVISLMYMIYVHKFIPRKDSLFKSFITIHVYAILIIIPFNYLTGGTYMMLVNPTVDILNILGPWPMSAIVLELLLLILLAISYGLTYFFILRHEK